MMQRTKMGMAMFLLSEVPFFLSLILAYVYYAGAMRNGPNAATSLNLPVTALFTVALLSSSVTLWRAEHSLAQENQRGARVWLTLTIVLGAIFLAGQAHEYAALFGKNITVASSLFGTTFFTLTGFHGLHVLAGLIALLVLLSLAWGGRLGRKRMLALETVGMYWHFVDGVWIAIFTLVYVLPHVL